MRAISVRQPWATAIVSWGKSPENRSRNIAGSYRGPLAIHASKIEDEDAWGDELIRDALDAAMRARPVVRFDRGAIIGMVDLWAVHRAAPGCCPNRGARPFGSPWAQPGQWHLCVTEPRVLAVPVPCRGALGLWTVPSDVAGLVETQLLAEQLRTDMDRLSGAVVNTSVRRLDGGPQ